MMKSGKHGPEQIVRLLQDADRLLVEGLPVAEVARQLGVVQQTYYRWRNQSGGLKAEDAKELKRLKVENGHVGAVSGGSRSGAGCFEGVG
jgi:transposase-like protein